MDIGSDDLQLMKSQPNYFLYARSRMRCIAKDGKNTGSGKPIAKLSTHIVWKSVSDALLFDDRIYARVDKYSIIRTRICRHRKSTFPCKYQSAYLEVVHNHLRPTSLSQSTSTRDCIVVGDCSEPCKWWNCFRLLQITYLFAHEFASCASPAAPRGRPSAAACQTLIISHATQCS